MAEGQEPAIAEQQVEGAGKEREAQDLHDEDRVEEEGRGDQQRQQAGEDRYVVGRHAAGRLLGGDRAAGCFSGDGHQAVLPKSPAGLTSSTRAMMTKMTTAEPSG